MCFYNSSLSRAHQEPVIEKQMPFFCHVMSAELVCVCLTVCVCTRKGKWDSKVGASLSQVLSTAFGLSVMADSAILAQTLG